jgi:predicted component of type VI protein secretion system
MDQMVVQPQERSQSPAEGLRDIVRRDLRSILAKAAEHGREISSHAVLEATAEIYEQLECFELWTYPL